MSDTIQINLPCKYFKKHIFVFQYLRKFDFFRIYSIKNVGGARNKLKYNAPIIYIEKFKDGTLYIFGSFLNQRTQSLGVCVHKGLLLFFNSNIMVSAVELCTVKHRVLNYLHIDSQKYTNQTIIYLHHTMKPLLIGLEIIYIIYILRNTLQKAMS